MDTALRVERLSAASLARVIEPDHDLPGTIGTGMVLPAELLSVAGLDIELETDQWNVLAREELASIIDAGVRFEALLMAGFGYQLGWQTDLVDPRVTYLLHELGEETRHSRLFIRVLAQLHPSAENPFTSGLASRVDRLITGRVLRRPALFCVMVLTGEEAPDLLQRLSSEHPGTDPFVREVNRYHRAEEARHLAYARAILPDLWTHASRLERFLVRRCAPVLMASMFDSLVHPGVYRTVGLPGWKTWNAVRRTPERINLRAIAFRPVCQALATSGAFGARSRIPRPWRRLCRLERTGRPLAPAT